MPTDNYVTFNPAITKHKPIITKLLIIIILLMYLIEIYFNAIYNDKVLILLGAKWNEGIKGGEYWRFITCSFLHGNIFHLFANIAAFYIFGREVESVFGTIRFISLFILSSWGATLTSYIFSPNIAIGVSGAIFGIIGAIMVFFYRQREKLIGAKLKFKTMYTLILINLLFGFFLPKIDNFAHVGGLITGTLLSWFISPEYKIEKIEEENKLILVKKNDLLRVCIGILIITITLYLITKFTLTL